VLNSKGIHLHTMKDPKTTPWDVPISDADLTKLKAGLEPQNQDNKWRISSSEQDQSLSITFARTALNREMYKFHVKASEGGNTIEAFTWEQSNGSASLSEELAKKQALTICRKIMKCDMEALPEGDDSVTWKLPAAEKGAD
jgi:hypothetical protein